MARQEYNCFNVLLTKDETFYVYNTSLVFILLFPWIFELKVNINDIFATTEFYKDLNGLLTLNTENKYTYTQIHYGILMIETHNHLKNDMKENVFEALRGIKWDICRTF